LSSDSPNEAQREEDALGKAYDARLMRRLLHYLRPYRLRVIGTIVVLLMGAAVELAGPLLTKTAIDRAIPAHDKRLLALLAAAFLGSIIVAFVLEYTSQILTTWLGQRVMFDMRKQIFAHLQRLELPFFDRNPVGRLMTRVTSDVEVLNDLFSSGVVTVFGDLFTLVIITIAMLYFDWRLTLVTLSVMPLVIFATRIFGIKAREAYRDTRTPLARINAYLQERITGVTIVQVFGREQQVSQRFHEIGDDYLEANLRNVTYIAVFLPVIELLTSIALAFIIVYGGGEVLRGQVTLGVVTAFIYWARRFFRPIQDLSDKYNMLQGAMAASERIFKLLDTPPEVSEPEQPLHLATPGRGEIEFRNVWFAYRKRDGAMVSHADQRRAPASNPDEDWDWVLKGASFKASPGERVAIVGHTGAGKTTLIGLLMRFYEPQRGEILYDGVPIRQVAPEEVRSRIGLVLQDVFLFSRDVGYNIRLGRNDIDDARMKLAAQRVGAAAFIERLPKHYGEELGERGSTLSVGERQLLSFARALAFDPQVLVLDEATSSVDSALEAQIETALETLMEHRTSLVIAHRLSTVQNADRILVFHHGEMREQGTHQELLARGGMYARLYELQFAGPVGLTGS
jgi:ATP-binding cassette subfamily B multidrug efflux pump